MKYNIHPAAEAFPMICADELQELAADIKANGLREPIWMYNDPDIGRVLLDGRNRIEACRIAGIEPTERDYTGSNPVAFLVSLNAHRRHMTPGQRAAAAVKLKPYFENEAKARQRDAGGWRGNRYVKPLAVSADWREPLESDVVEINPDQHQPIAQPTDDEEKHEPRTDVVVVVHGQESKPVASDIKSVDIKESCQQAKKSDAQEIKPEPYFPSQEKYDNKKREQKAAYQVAKVVGASGRNVERYERIQREAPDMIPKVESGAISLDRADRIIRDRISEARKVEEAKRQAQAIGSKLKVDIRHGDFREVLADLSDIDAIITDPPYPKEFLPLLADLATFADRVLKPDGVLAVLIGQSHLPDVYRLLSGGRPYRWTACYYMPGHGYSAHQSRVLSNWKPVIVYGGGPRFADIIKSDACYAGQSYHKWGQDYTAFSTLVSRLTTADQTIVDPFMGAGTTLLAAHSLGRHCIGCDIDIESVAKANERLQ